MQSEQGPSLEKQRTHLSVLASIVLGTLVLRLWPGWVMRLDLACVLEKYAGIRCPFCGMTRDFMAILHGKAPELNVFSWPAICSVYLAYPLLVVWLWRRGRLEWFHQPVVVRGVVVGLVVMMAVNNFVR